MTTAAAITATGIHVPAAPVTVKANASHAAKATAQCFNATGDTGQR